jgi:predicted nucleic acid-binding protein
MKVYLDTCSLQRPLDSRTQIRISLEAEAVLGIIALVEEGELELVSSDVLLFETRRNPRSERRAYAMEVLGKANAFIQLTAQIRERSVELEHDGLKPLDSLHLATAEAAEVDYFCTTDDKLLKRGKAAARKGVRVVSPIELIEEIR